MQNILRGRWKQAAILPDPHTLHYLRKGSRRYTKCNFSKGAQCFKKVENPCCRVSLLGLVTLRFLETLFIRSQVDGGDFYSSWNQRTNKLSIGIENHIVQLMLKIVHNKLGSL